MKNILIILSFLTGLTALSSCNSEKNNNIDKNQVLLNKKLINASLHGKIDSVKMLINNGANINYKDSSGGWTALMYASGSAYLPEFEEITSFLINKKADINSCSSSGVTALMLASMGGKPATVKKLLDAGAMVNAEDSSGLTALIYAVTGCSIENEDTAVEKVKYLISFGSDINHKDFSGKTALIYATERNLCKIRELIEKTGG